MAYLVKIIILATHHPHYHPMWCTCVKDNVIKAIYAIACYWTKVCILETMFMVGCIHSECFKYLLILINVHRMMTSQITIKVSDWRYNLQHIVTQASVIVYAAMVPNQWIYPVHVS